MTCPCWMIMTMRALGDGYIVWDKAATIEFVKPGRVTVVAEFDLGDEVLAHIRGATADGDKCLHWFETDIIDGDGDIVAQVRKQVYVRRTQPRGATHSAGAPVDAYRKSLGSGPSVPVRIHLGGTRSVKQNNTTRLSTKIHNKKHTH